MSESWRRVRRIHLWWIVCTLCLLPCHVELPQAIQVSVVVSLVFWTSIAPFVCSFGTERDAEIRSRFFLNFFNYVFCVFDWIHFESIELGKEHQGFQAPFRMRPLVKMVTPRVPALQTYACRNMSKEKKKKKKEKGTLTTISNHRMRTMHSLYKRFWEDNVIQIENIASNIMTSECCMFCHVTGVYLSEACIEATPPLFKFGVTCLCAWPDGGPIEGVCLWRPRSTSGLSPTIRLVAPRNQWSGPVK